jgi:hypothetical protein
LADDAGELDVAAVLQDDPLHGWQTEAGENLKQP